MDAIETLMSEHRLIERALDALSAFADEVRRKTPAESDKAELGRFVRFIREFADAHHHGKEEDFLFAEMVANGFPSQGGPIAVMLHEHEVGRAYVKALRRFAEQETPWSVEDRQEVADAAAGYVNLLHAHIHKEDAILYPMAEQRLPPEALERVNARCEAFESEHASSGHVGALQELADDLVSRHAAALHRGDEPPRARFHGGCC